MARFVFRITRAHQSMKRNRVDRILSNIIGCNHNSVWSPIQHIYPKGYIHKQIYQHYGSFQCPYLHLWWFIDMLNGIKKYIKWTEANEQCRSRHRSMFIPVNVMKSIVFAHIARGEAMAHTCPPQSYRKACTIAVFHGGIRTDSTANVPLAWYLDRHVNRIVFSDIFFCTWCIYNSACHTKNEGFS